MTTRAISLAYLALVGCSALPRDPEGTTERVRTAHVMRVGFTNEQEVKDSRAGDVVARLAAATGARIRSVEGEQEALLVALEHGQLDLVIARFEPKSPWADRVALAPPLPHGWDESPAHAVTDLRAATRNGENRWTMMVEAESRAVAREGGT